MRTASHVGGMAVRSMKTRRENPMIDAITVEEEKRGSERVIPLRASQCSADIDAEA